MKTPKFSKVEKNTKDSAKHALLGQLLFGYFLVCASFCSVFSSHMVDDMCARIELNS